MARVLDYTARKHAPGWDVSVEEVYPRTLQSAMGNISHARNAEKAVEWERIVNAAPEGQRLLIIDVDMFVTSCLDSIWDTPFDVMITTKESRFPWNSGVVAIRAGAKARGFFAQWTRESLRLLGNSADHQQWRKKYGGLHQAALGACLEGGMVERLGLNIARLPCDLWNCEDSGWEKFDPAVTKLVHVKSSLRLAVFHMAAGGSMARTRRLAALWRTEEIEMTAGRSSESVVLSS